MFSRRLFAASCLLLIGSTGILAQDATRKSPSVAPVVGQGPFLVKPYLQLGHAQAQGKIVLVWHTTDADAAWVVEYRPGTGRRWQTAASPVVSVAWRSRESSRTGSINVALTGLEPGQIFAYRVSKGGQVVFESEARAPKAADQPHRFVVFGDCGADTPEERAIAYRTFLAKPDFVMITGDIVYGKGSISEYRTKYWPIFNSDQASPSSGAPLLRSTLFVGGARQPRHRFARPGKDAGRPRVFLLLAPAAERPDRQSRRPDHRAAGRTGGEPESVYRCRRQRLSADGQFLVRLRQRPLDGPRRECHGRLDQPRAQGLGRQRPGSRQGSDLAVRQLPSAGIQFIQDLTSANSTCGSWRRSSRRARSMSFSTDTSTTTSGPTRSVSSRPQQNNAAPVADEKARTPKGGASTASSRSTSRSTARPTPRPTA